MPTKVAMQRKLSVSGGLACFLIMRNCRKWRLGITFPIQSQIQMVQDGIAQCICFHAVYFKHPSLMIKKLMWLPVVPNLPLGSSSCWENLAHYGLFCSISHATRWQGFIRQILWINLQRPALHATKKSSLAEQNWKPIMNSVTVAAYCQIMH